MTTTGTGTLTTASTLDGAGRTTGIATSGTSSDTLTQAYDALDRMTGLSRGASTITAFTYNSDGTAASRTDYDPAGGSHASYFTYTALGQLASASLPEGAGTAAYAWGLDGNLASRTWGSHVSGTYAYDRAKRPINLTIEFDTTSAGGFAREYDRAGNATRESQQLNGIGTGLAASGIQYFEYDTASRLTRSYFGVSEDPTRQRLYAYDASGNRLSVADEGATFYYSYDATDALTKKGTDPYGLGADAFLYDELGQLQTSRPSDPDSAAIDTTAYRYDPAGHLVGIDVAGSIDKDVTFAIDALGRQASRTVGTADPLIYAYLGTSAQVSSTATDGSSITLSAYSAIDAIGNRISTGTPDALGYLMADLHGNVAASISNGSSPSYLSAYRYDPYGQTLDTFSGSNPVPVPFRYQGRILQSADGATDLYDFGARSYDPNLGVFTSFDSVSGGVQNPLTLNRYLYALGNPATLIDPDGHCAYNANTHQTYDDTNGVCTGTAKGYTGVLTPPPTPPSGPLGPQDPHPPFIAPYTGPPTCRDPICSLNNLIGAVGDVYTQPQQACMPWDRDETTGRCPSLLQREQSELPKVATAALVAAGVAVCWAGVGVCATAALTAVDKVKGALSAACTKLKICDKVDDVPAGSQVEQQIDAAKLLAHEDSCQRGGLASICKLNPDDTGDHQQWAGCP